MRVVQKAGELLSNMHVALVNQFLKALRKKNEISTLTVHGMLLVRKEGAMICKLEMPVVDVSCHFTSELVDHLTLSITLESSMGGLTHDIVCITTRYLLQDF